MATSKDKKTRVREHLRVSSSGKVTIVDEHDRSDNAGDELPPEIAAELAAVEQQTEVPATADVAVDPLEETQGRHVDQELAVDEDWVGPAAVEDPVPETDQQVEAQVAAASKNSGRLSAAEELQLWREWKASGMNPERLEPLLRSLQPVIRAKMSPFRGRLKMIPDKVLEAEYQLETVNALRTYNPDKGASLGTYVYRYLDKVHRFVNENQNIGRIPENRVYKIAEYNNARNKLTESLGRQPTLEEMSSELKWKKAEVERMDSELRNDLTTQGFESDPFVFTPSKSDEVLRLLKYELPENERAVYELMIGSNGPPMTSTGDIAKKLGIPDYQVSRLRDKIRIRAERYLNEK